MASYRLKVVRRNMLGAFPDMPDEERERLEQRFYHHLADYIVETIKLGSISLNEIKDRACIENPELVDELMRKGHTCVIMLMGHYGNWEWFTAGNSFFEDACIYQIYRSLKSKSFDRLFIKLRTRFGARGIEKKNTFRDIVKLKQNGTRSAVVLLADQTPSMGNINYWTSFLNQQSPFLNGAERIAKKLNIPLLFLDIRKKERGRYAVTFSLITDEPLLTPDFWITERYARLMEANILRDPAYWLWTHKRWKYAKEEA
jgi:KDO2-lipid IV(A) lauroyltransferase